MYINELKEPDLKQVTLKLVTKEIHMKLSTIKNVLVAVLIGYSLRVFSGPTVSGGGTGSTATYASCFNNDYIFQIRGTAIPTFTQGLLQNRYGKVIATLNCKREALDSAPGGRSAVNKLWNCEQYPAHEGQALVRMETSRLTGLTSAYVLMKQIYPLGPKAIATLICRN